MECQFPLGELIEYGNNLDAAGQHELAIVLYQTWLDHNTTPFNYCVLFNQGTSLSALNKLDEAKRAYQRAIELSPTFLQAHVNLAMVYERLQQPEAALAELLWVAHTAANDGEQGALKLMAMKNLGRIYEVRKQYGEAHAWLNKCLEVRPDQADVIQHLVFMRARMCEWPIYTQIAQATPELMRKHTSAMGTISQTDDPQAQLAAARALRH